MIAAALYGMCPGYFPLVRSATGFQTSASIGIYYVVLLLVDAAGRTRAEERARRAGLLVLALGLTSAADVRSAYREISSHAHALAGPEGIVAGPDGNLWGTENGASQIFKITTGGSPTASSTSAAEWRAPWATWPGRCKP